MVHSTPLKGNSFFGHGWSLAIIKRHNFLMQLDKKKN